MLQLKKALREANLASQDRVEVACEDLERLMTQHQEMDKRLAACMDKLSAEDCQELFGDLFDAPGNEREVSAP